MKRKISSAANPSLFFIFNKTSVKDKRFSAGHALEEVNVFNKLSRYHIKIP